MIRLTLLRLAVLGSLLVTAPARAAAAPEPVDFNFHIRPLLSDRCFACHGPDEKARKGKLDLRTREGALRGGGSGKAGVVPGKPDESEILRRLTTDDPDEKMPPPESKLPSLTAEEIGRVRRWLAEGAPYKEHWAFLPPGHPEPPRVRIPRSARPNEIDRFVAARLASEGMRLQEEAPRETLIRRLTLDLTGLPPTIEEMDAFLGDRSRDAYEKVVDRLLASPRYGEWMAVEWMDLSRYADTYGYQADVDRDLSPWRDWVIRAFNENLPWDRFITWQVAGDLLPDATRDQVLATAFNRLHRQTNEGGSIEEEFRIEYVADRVHTMGTAFLGLTLECARCHDHKYDPVNQKDYYRLSAFFNSIDESGLYSHFTRATPTPVLLLWEGDAEARHAAAREAILAAERDLDRARAAARARLPAEILASAPVPAARLEFETLEGGRTPDAMSTNQVVLHDGPVLAEGREGRAIQFSGDNSAVLPRAGKFGRTDPFSFGLWLKPTEKQSRAVVFHASRAWTDSGSRGYELVLDEGRPFFALIHFWPGNAVAVRAREALATGEWTHLGVTYDGSSRASGLRLYLNGKPVEAEVVRDHLYKDIQHRGEWGDSDVGSVPLTLAGRFRDNGFKNGLIDTFQVFDAELTPLEMALVFEAAPAGKPAAGGREGATAAEASARALAHAVERSDEVRAARERLREARAEENRIVTPVREIMVMQELPEPRTAHVLRRGAYDAPGEAVGPGVPERIHPAAAGAPANRLGLARWLVDPEHPLTARVAVNRIWKLHFGRGLVATSWDFGAQGELPSHPELLDWLARRFVASGWDRKALHKHIVLSATYRQVSTAPADWIARDPDNRLLARGPRHRLSAEQIRDGALAASGLLVPTLGGPSVKPYQPAGVWEEAGTGKSYTQDKGEKLHRRSLYTFWRRTAPPPSMLTFDATSREVCTAKRESTTTPLQSLVLLNDPQFLEASRVLAEHLLEAHPEDVDARITEAFRRLAARVPGPREREILRRLYTEQVERFRSAPDAAEKVVAVGETPRRPGLAVPDLAATTVLASALMNHDAFVMKR